MKARISFLHVLFAAAACHLAATSQAAPVITATKDDGLAAGLRKVPGNNIVYDIGISNTGDATATNVQYTDPDPANTSFVSVFTTPIARADSYTAIGNVQISIAAPGVLANDNDADAVGPALTVSASPTTTSGGGNLSVAANGSFTYNPAPGYTGNDTFTYTLSDGEGNTDTATVTIAVGGTVWFINSAAAAGGDGRLTAPFNTMAAYTGSAPTKDAGDNIFLYTGTYTTGLTLGSNQRLIGQGAGTTLQAITGLTPPTGSLAFPATGGTRPTIAVTSGTGVILNSGNTVNGLNVTNSAGSGITGSAVGTLTLAAFDVTVTGGSALSLTTSGTVTATGADNDLSSSNGTALNVTSVTIGGAGLAFKSISSGGSATAGIVLDNTGASGGLTVAGSGTAGSGGTIANKTGGNILTGGSATGQTTSGTGGTGIFLRSTLNPSFTRMQVNDCTNFGIYGNNVTGFTLANSVVNGTNGNSNAGNQEEASIRFDNLLGSASIANSTVSGGAYGNIALFNTSGTLNRLTLNTNTFGLISATIGNDNVSMQVFNSATANITATSNIFSGTRSDFFEAIANNNSFMDVVARGNDFNNGQAIIPGGGVGVSVRGGSGGKTSTATTTFDISNNTINDGGANAFDTVGIFVAKGQDLGTMVGTIQGNTLVAKTGSNSDGIFVRSAGNGTTTVLIRNNTVTNWGNVGIHLQSNDGTSTMNASLFGNSVTAPGSAFPFSAVFADNGATVGPPADTNTMNLVIGSAVAGEVAKQNTLAGGASAAVDVGISNFHVTNTHVNFSKNGSGSSTVAGVIGDDNVGTPSADTSGGNGPITLVTTLPALPPAVAPLLLAPEGVEGISPDARQAPTAAFGNDPAPRPNVPDGMPGNIRSLTQTELDSLVAAALERWESSGLTGEQAAALRRVKFEVADLPGMYLGEAGGEHIRVDDNAGGKGWFMGATAEDDTQFAKEVSSTRRYADPAGAPAGRIDLLTAILHEMGHALGLEDSYAGLDRDNLMYGFLTTGERRLPAKGQADGAIPHGEACTHFLSTPLAIGDLPPGKTVTITYTVTINATSAIAISSQGTVSGGNITSKVTNDPQTGAADDATVTPIQQPPVVSNVSASINEDAVLTFAAANFTGSYSDPNSDALATVRISSLPANGVLKVGATTVATAPTDVPIASIGTLTYTPTGNYNGSDSFGWSGSDGTSFALSAATVNLTVNAVNDKPTFTASNPPAVNEDAGAQSVPSFASGFNAGAANESAQTVVAYTVSNVSNAALFSSGPAVAADGTLSYTPAANANGSSTFQLRVQDSGGTANGGIDTSDAQTFTITVNAVNDAPAITGQGTVFTVEGVGRTIALADLSVTDPDNAYPAGFSLNVSDGANYTRSGSTVTPVANFTGTLSVAVKVNDGTADSNTFNLAVIVNPTAEHVTRSGSIAQEPGGGYRISFIGNPGVTYAIQYSDDLTEWHPLGTATAGPDAIFSIVDIPPADTPQRFYRVALPYENDFNASLGGATLRGPALWINGAVRLTDAVGGQVSAVVFDGIAATPELTGFTARFNLTIGPAGNPDPADGVNFAVGDLGAGGWGESGPVTTSNLSVGFDTFNNGTATGNRGVHVWVNGVHLAVDPTSPFTNGAAVPVEISYDIVTGLTVKFNGATLFNNLPTPGFTFPPGGKFGIGARTGGSVETAVVDDVAIFPK